MLHIMYILGAEGGTCVIIYCASFVKVMENTRSIGL